MNMNEVTVSYPPGTRLFWSCRRDVVTVRKYLVVQCYCCRKKAKGIFQPNKRFLCFREVRVVLNYVSYFEGLSVSLTTVIFSLLLGLMLVVVGSPSHDDCFHVY